MQIVRGPFAVVGVFLIAAGALLVQYGLSSGPGAAVPFGVGYAGGGLVMLAMAFRPYRRG